MAEQDQPRESNTDEVDRTHHGERDSVISETPDMARVRLRRNMAATRLSRTRSRRTSCGSTIDISRDGGRRRQRHLHHASHAKFYEDQRVSAEHGSSGAHEALGKRASTGTIVTGESSVQDQEYAELRKIADSVDLTRRRSRRPASNCTASKLGQYGEGARLQLGPTRMFLPIAMAQTLKAPKGDYGDRARIKVTMQPVHPNHAPMPRQVDGLERGAAAICRWWLGWSSSRRTSLGMSQSPPHGKPLQASQRERRRGHKRATGFARDLGVSRRIRITTCRPSARGRRR